MAAWDSWKGEQPVKSQEAVGVDPALGLTEEGDTTCNLLVHGTDQNVKSKCHPGLGIHAFGRDA